MPRRGFEETVLPHLDAAFNYARYLTRSHAEAEDVVQDACVRAMRYFSSLRDDDARPWLLAIVRNTWYSRVSRRANVMEVSADDSPIHDRPDQAVDPEERHSARAYSRARRARVALYGAFTSSPAPF